MGNRVRLAFPLFLPACLALAGCPGKPEPKNDAGTNGPPGARMNAKSALPPGFEGAFIVPDGDKDRHGNSS